MSAGPVSFPNWSELSSAVPAGWFRADRLPDSVDARVDAVVRAALAASDVDRPFFDPDEVGARLLQTYAFRASTRAVRQGSIELLRLAVVALVLAQPAADYREQMRRMSVVADASHRLGSSLGDLTDDLSTRWPADRLARLKQYTSTHAGGARGLADMGFRAVGDAANFRYVDEFSGPPDPGAAADLLEWAGGPALEVERLRREADESPT